MKQIQRKDVHVLSRHSNLSEANLDKLLKENVYTGKADWATFIKYFLLSLGVGFVVFGVLFFFAFNWENLNKFVKLGLVQALVVCSTAFALVSKINPILRKILLTAAAALVGVMFAVYGQVYQTGANAYDFFLAWTICISLWVFVARFAPLWILYLFLINSTFILYVDQLGFAYLEDYSGLILFVGNALVLALATLLHSINNTLKIPKWFFVTIGIGLLILGTYKCMEEFYKPSETFLVTLLSVCVFYAIGIWYGIKTKDAFYLSAVPFSAMLILVGYLNILFDSTEMLLALGLLVIIATSLIIKNLLSMQNKKL